MARILFLALAFGGLIVFLVHRRRYLDRCPPQLEYDVDAYGGEAGRRDGRIASPFGGLARPEAKRMAP
jgi:hypothetical protein